MRDRGDEARLRDDQANTLFPPLNLMKVKTPWTTQVSAGRAVLAAQARAWTPR